MVATSRQVNPMSYENAIGVRLPSKTRQRVAKSAAILSLPHSTFIRVLVNLALDQVERDPSILLNRSGAASVSSEC